jgi:hypothetical protein
VEHHCSFPELNFVIRNRNFHYAKILKMNRRRPARTGYFQYPRMIDPLNEKFLFKSLLKYSKKRLLYLRHHSPFQQFSVIFFGAQLYSLLSEQLLSFPQLTASLYFKDHVNGFGCITAFVFGPVRLSSVFGSVRPGLGILFTGTGTGTGFFGLN